jgi:hypothetical protein
MKSSTPTARIPRNKNNFLVIDMDVHVNETPGDLARIVSRVGAISGTVVANEETGWKRIWQHDAEIAVCRRQHGHFPAQISYINRSAITGDFSPKSIHHDFAPSLRHRGGIPGMIKMMNPRVGAYIKPVAASNLKDGAPFHSFHCPGLTAAELARERERRKRVNNSHNGAGKRLPAVC